MDIPSTITSQYLQDGTNFYSFYQKSEILPEKLPTTTGETVKFIFTVSPNLYINTSTICLEAVISVPQSSLQGCNLILDGSSQSLISELKLESNAQIIEQITKYDIVSSQLEHMGINNNSKEHRYYFGFVQDPMKSGFPDQQFQTHKQVETAFRDVAPTDTNVGKQSNSMTCHAFMPYDTIPKSLSNKLGTGPSVDTLYDYASNDTANNKNFGRPMGFYWQSANLDPSVFEPNQQSTVMGPRDKFWQCIPPNINFEFGNNNIQSSEILNRKLQRSLGAVPSGTNAFNTFGPVQFTRHRPEAVGMLLSGEGGIQGPHSQMIVNHCDGDFKFNQKDPTTGTNVQTKYCKVGVVDVNSRVLSGDNNYSFHQTEVAAMHGYQCMSSMFTSKFAKNLQLSSEHYTHWLRNGRVLDVPVRQRFLKLLVPLNSAILGQLNQKYMPGSCLGRMVLYVTLNKYAFFLSGISNIYDGQFINSAAQVQAVQVGRNWNFDSLKLVMESYRYGESQNDALQAKLQGGILNNNLQAYPAGEYSVSNTQLLNSTNWNLTCRIPAVRLITMAIYSNDYMNYTFRRKLGRLSGNITSLRLRITDTYLPQDPITGNAGNPVCFNSGDDSNLNYLLWLHKSLSCFKNNTDSCPFNQYNFAINDCAYNPDIFTYPNANSTTESSGLLGSKHLWFGQTGILEQSFYGMALYIWAFGQLPMMPQSNVGLDTRNLDIFQIEISVDSGYIGNPRPQTIVFTAYADMIFRVYQRNIIVMGK